jgi:hypothetical protein
MVNVKTVFVTMFLLALILAGVFSCKKDVTPGLDFGYGYFPNTVGKYVIYDVDSIVCNSLDYKVDTFSYQLKELVQSIFLDNSNRPTMRIERYIKNFSKDSSYSLMAWRLKNVWMANRTLTDAEKVESNTRFVKLVFPVVSNQTWNGNAFNTLGVWQYSYLNINQHRSVRKFVSDSVLSVVQYNNQNYVSDSCYLEMYAKNVGLIYKRSIGVSFKNPFFYPVLVPDSFVSGVLIPPSLPDSTTGLLKYQQTINSHN